MTCTISVIAIVALLTLGTLYLRSKDLRVEILSYNDSGDPKELRVWLE